MILQACKMERVARRYTNLLVEACGYSELEASLIAWRLIGGGLTLTVVRPANDPSDSISPVYTTQGDRL